jgi:YVTN family beta-propeller protein
VVNNVTNNLSVLNTATGAVTATIPLGTSPWMAAISPDGRFAYVTNKETNSVTVLAIAH